MNSLLKLLKLRNNCFPELVDDISVVMVSTVVTPSPTRAGVAPRFNQKETQEMTTMREEGM